MKVKQTLYPSLLIGEMFFPITNDERNLSEVIKRAGEIGFYEVVEMGMIFDKKAAMDIRTTCEDKGLRLLQWATLTINKEGLNLSSTDKDIRSKSLARVKELIYLSAESGAKTIGITSGPDAGAVYRESAKNCLADSVQVICDEVKKYKNMNVVMEHLDRYVHKKQLLGPVDETVAWIMSIRKECPNLYLVWDAAHAALGGENLITTINQAAPFMSGIHLSNAILNPSDPLYGDNHMKSGAPGFLTVEVAAELLKTAICLNTPKELNGISAAIEVRPKQGDDLWENEKTCREFLIEAIKLINA